MNTKARQKIIAVILALVLAASVLVTVNVMTVNANDDYMSAPQITVLTHGLADFNGASHWSNDQIGHDEEGYEKKQFHFCYDEDSLIHRISQKAGGANIYWAIATGTSSYELYNIGGENIDLYGTDYFEAVNTGKFKPTTINDVSKHIIIVFEASDGEAYNDEVYAEFKYIMNSVIERVKTLNPGQKKPKVNLIGHSRGGITNLQYALDYPENVHTTISMGTPYFLSPAAQSIGELILNPKNPNGLRDTVNATKYNRYYNRWEEGYESKYKKINAISIGSMVTLDFLEKSLTNHGDAFGMVFGKLVKTFYSTILNNIILVGLEAVLTTVYVVLLGMIPMLGEFFSEEQVINLIKLLNNEIEKGSILKGLLTLNTPEQELANGVWFSDVMVPTGVQLGIDSEKPSKNYNFTKYLRLFSNYTWGDKPNRNVNDLPIIHNIETQDEKIGSMVLNNLVLKTGDVPASYNIDISNNSKVDGKWIIKVRNIYDNRREYAYNKKMCFENDAKNWTGLTDIETFWLDPGDTKIIEIAGNGTATHIAVSSINGNTRTIRYANELSFDFGVPDMVTGTSSKAVYSYTHHGLKISIVGKNNGTWKFRIINNTGSARKFDYNTKMCFADNAKKWIDINNISSIYLSKGESSEIYIQENGMATHIALNYTTGTQRKVIYAYGLDANGQMIVDGATLSYDETLQILGKNGNKWRIRILNTFGETREVHYNKKMCFENDAKNWSGLGNIEGFWLSSGASREVEIEENAFATHIAVGFSNNNQQDIKYADQLNISGNMNVQSTVRYYFNTFFNITNAGKVGNRWKINIYNPSGVATTVYYNTKMCNEGDARNWVGLTNIAAIQIGAYSTVQVEIEENWFATSIAISGVRRSGQRAVTYAKNLNPNGSMTIMYNAV